MKIALSFAALAAVASSFAGTYTASLGNVTLTGTGVTTVSANLSGLNGPVRGFGIAGDWSIVTPNGTTASTTQWSSEFGTTLIAPGGSTFARRSVGGAGSANAYTFAPTGSATWNNTSPAYDTFYNTATNGVWSFGMNQSYGPAGVTSLANAGATFFTDYLAPVTTSITANSLTYNRATSLTAVATGTATGTNVQYNAVSFTIDKAGSYLIGGGYTALSTGTATGLWDGYLSLYSGAFNSASPLANLIGLDDDGFGGSTGGASSMLVSLGAGTYTAVLSEYSSTIVGATASGSATLFVAGGAQPVPEPASMVALGLGAAAMLRRRKKA